MIVNDVRYHVRRFGQGDPLVLLHGFTGSSANWQAELFPDQQVIAPDLLGHGETEAPEQFSRYQMVLAAHDLVALTRRLVEPPVNLLGYSMGGRLALFTALHYPDFAKRLILESASPGIADVQGRLARNTADLELGRRIIRDGIPAFVDDWENLPLFATQTPDQRAQLRPGRLANNPTGLANSLFGMGTGCQPPLWERLHELTIPVLLIAGELDTKFTAIARQMSENIPHVTLAIIPNAGHTVHLEQPERYGVAVQTFLRS